MNDYERIMQLRQRDPKRFAVSTIAVRYEALKKRMDDRAKYERGEITRHGFTPISDKEVALFKADIADRVRTCIALYGLTQADFNSYSIPLGITIH